MQGMCKKAVAAFYGKTPKRISREEVEQLKGQVCEKFDFASAVGAGEQSELNRKVWYSEGMTLDCAREGLEVLLRSPRTRSERNSKPKPELEPPSPVTRERKLNGGQGGLGWRTRESFHPRGRTEWSGPISVANLAEGLAKLAYVVPSFLKPEYSLS